MGWKAVVVGWLLKAVKVDVDTMCNAIETMDVNQDGSLDVGAPAAGSLERVKK